jgi:hypothetical protein
MVFIIKMLYKNNLFDMELRNCFDFFNTKCAGFIIEPLVKLFVPLQNYFSSRKTVCTQEKKNWRNLVVCWI